MIVLDTNIISEMVKPSPSANVIEWLNTQDSGDLYVTVFDRESAHEYGRLMATRQKRGRRLSAPDG